MNNVPKVNEKRNADKKFCRENKKIAEQENARLLSYKAKSFCPLTFGLGYARIATTPRQKMEKYKDIVKFFSNKRTKCQKSVYVRGRDNFFAESS